MRARIFYDPYNAVAMHCIVMCESSGDKHVDLNRRGWLWQEEMFHQDDRFSFAEKSAAARGCWWRHLPPNHRWRTEPSVLLEMSWLSWGRGCSEEAEQTLLPHLAEKPIHGKGGVSFSSSLSYFSQKCVKKTRNVT